MSSTIFSTPFRFPAFFNDARYDPDAIQRLTDGLVSLSNTGCKESAPIFKSKIKWIENEGDTPIMLDVALFAACTKGGTPYLSGSIKRSMLPKPQKEAPQGDTDQDDDIPF